MTEAFYVTMIRAQRVAYLAGPLDSKEAAEALVKPARDVACKVNEFHWFDAFGVTRIERTQDALDGRPWFKGRLNAQLGLAA